MKYHSLPDSRQRATSPRSLPRRLQRQFYAIPQCLRTSILLILTVVAVTGFTRYLRNRRDFSVKQYPSDFSTLAAFHPEALWHPQHPVRHQNGTHINERYIFMRELGHGFEGSASLYVDVNDGDVVVVKTYNSILRNDLPPSLEADFEGFGSKWPTGIEASLLIGNWQGVNGPAYVPVRDYFILQNTRFDWRWALVTPFIEAGTLETLAKSTKFHERTPQKLDKIFRPALEVVLQNVGTLHASGYCHDDIKPDNIFVANTTHWLLGDLGNVRHLSHPWHFTGKIKRENQQADCKLNDVRRLLKTYVSFLRQASGDASGFDAAFWGGEQAWSRLYWNWMQEPEYVDATLSLSRRLNSGEEAEWKPNDDGMVSVCLKRKLDLELLTTNLHRKPTDYWPLRWC